MRRLLQLLCGNNADTVSGKIRGILSKDNQPVDDASSSLLQSFRTQAYPWKFEAEFLSEGHSKLIHLIRIFYIFLDTSKLMVLYLKTVTKKVKKLVQEAKRYNLEPVTTAPESYHRSYAATTLLEASSMVGRDKEVAKLKNLLLDKEKFVVIAVTGERGSGKTTVAAAIYHQIKQQFGCYAWVVVSRKPETAILRDILKSFLESLSMMSPSNLESLDAASLKDKIRLLLDGKEFLLAIDDVLDIYKWNFIRIALPARCRGKILLISQHSTFPTKFTVNLKSLSSDHALQLLRKRALLDPDKSEFWPLVQSLAEEIVEMCDGDPFAISMIGGLLSTKRKVSEWNRVCQWLKNSLNGTQILRTLSTNHKVSERNIASQRLGKEMLSTNQQVSDWTPSKQTSSLQNVPQRLVNTVSTTWEDSGWSIVGKKGTRIATSTPSKTQKDSKSNISHRRWRPFAGMPSTIQLISKWSTAHQRLMNTPAEVQSQGMLSTKKEFSKRSSVHQKLENSHFVQYSYADLSPVLKSCFLYISLFPPHYEISCKRLVRLLIAEGFIENNRDGRTIEETVSFQLYELIQRNLLQGGQVGADGEIKTCKTLQVMRDFALRQSCIESFSTIMDSVETSFSKSGYRLSLHDQDKNIEVAALNLNKIRSFLGFTGCKDQVQIMIPNCTFKLLLLLDLQHLPLDNLPTVVGDLVLLRYLGLRATEINKLPATIKKLQRLQTIDVRDTPIEDMPMGLEGLKKLRHLLLAGSFNDKAIELSVEIEIFQDLQTLAGVKLTEGAARQLIHLSQLRKLSVGMIKSRLSISVLKAIERMKFLKSLTLKCALGQYIDIKSCNLPKDLEKLRVGGRVENLFHAIINLNNLRYLYLWDRATTEDPISSLQHLQNLVLLSLCNSSIGEKICFGENSFPKLKKLSIIRFKNLNECGEIMAGSLQKLETLTIGYCPKLEVAPNGLQNLTSLQVLQLTSMPGKYVENVSKVHEMHCLKFSLLVRGTTEVSSSLVPGTRISLPPPLPPYAFKQSS